MTKKKSNSGSVASQPSPEQSGKFGRKVVSFSEIQLNESFYLPNYRLGFEQKFTKISANTYYEVITKQVYWTDANLQVDSDHVIKEVKDEK